MKKFKYLKISNTKKLRYIDNYYKKKLYIIFLPGFMSDIDGKKPQVFKKYAVKNSVVDSKWDLVTGDKKEIYDLARKSYLAAKDNSFGEYDMIHTENFVLVDKKKQIRGFYDGTDKDEINRLENELKALGNGNL